MIIYYLSKEAEITPESIINHSKSVGERGGGKQDNNNNNKNAQNGHFRG